MKRFVPIVLMITSSSCADDPAAFSSTEFEPAYSISDGAHGGLEHFYFLPPMAPNPAASGQFDPSYLAALSIRICSWSEGEGCDGSDVAHFTALEGTDGEVLSLEQDHYAAHWHTDASSLVPGVVYRIRVLLSESELGHADIEVVANGKDLKNVDNDDYVALKDGRTLPIRFRIETGLVIPPPELPTVEVRVFNVDDQIDVTLSNGLVGQDNPIGTVPSGGTGTFDVSNLVVAGENVIRWTVENHSPNAGWKWGLEITVNGVTKYLESCGIPGAGCNGDAHDLGIVGIGECRFDVPSPDVELQCSFELVDLPDVVVRVFNVDDQIDVTLSNEFVGNDSPVGTVPSGGTGTFDVSNLVVAGENVIRWTVENHSPNAGWKWGLEITVNGVTKYLESCGMPGAGCNGDAHDVGVVGAGECVFTLPAADVALSCTFEFTQTPDAPNAMVGLASAGSTTTDRAYVPGEFVAEISDVMQGIQTDGPVSTRFQVP